MIIWRTGIPPGASAIRALRPTLSPRVLGAFHFRRVYFAIGSQPRLDFCQLIRTWTESGLSAQRAIRKSAPLTAIDKSGGMVG